MIKPIKTQKRLFKLVQIVLSVYIAGFYITRIFKSDLEGFIYTTSAPVLVALGLIASLGFSFASAMPKGRDRNLTLLASEKLFHSTVKFLFAILMGVMAIEVDKITFWPDAVAVLKYLITLLGILTLSMSFYAAVYGFDWLGDVFYERWNRRMIPEEEEVMLKGRIKESKEELIEIPRPKEQEVDEELANNEKLTDKN